MSLNGWERNEKNHHKVPQLYSYHMLPCQTALLPLGIDSSCLWTPLEEEWTPSCSKMLPHSCFDDGKELSDVSVQILPKIFIRVLVTLKSTAYASHHFYTYQTSLLAVPDPAIRGAIPLDRNSYLITRPTIVFICWQSSLPKDKWSPTMPTRPPLLNTATWSPHSS